MSDSPRVGLSSIYDANGDVETEVLQWLYRLLEERDPIANISHKKMPAYGDHINFVMSKPYLGWYIIDNTHQPVGTIYITHNKEIGIFIKQGFGGRGYGRSAVGRLMRMHDGPYRAHVAPGNVGSQRFFSKIGFRLVQHTYINDD